MAKKAAVARRVKMTRIDKIIKLIEDRLEANEVDYEGTDLYDVDFTMIRGELKRLFGKPLTPKPTAARGRKGK